jgi:hypothetical protein
MSADGTFDPAKVIAAGLAVVADLAGDPSLAAGGAGIFKAAEPVVRPEIGAGDEATITVPCVRMKDKLPALLVVLQDRAIVAWKSGVYRRPCT